MDSRTNANQRRVPFPPASLGHRHDRVGPTSTLETPLKITSIGLHAEDSFKEYIHKHTGFKLGKFALRIQGIEIRLKDEGGPGSTSPYSCTLIVAMEQEADVAVGRCGDTLQAAFDRAIQVAERTIRRLLQRRRALGRSSGSGDNLLPGQE